MKPLLSDRYAEAVADCERLVEKQKKELERLKRLQKRSKALMLLWPEKVSSKNAYKTIQSAQILIAFRERFEKSEKYSSLSEVALSTQQLWRNTQLPTVYNNTDPTPKFRGYLSKLQNNKLIIFNNELRKWQLTQRAMVRLD